MALTHDKLLQMRVSEEFLRAIDEWRRQQDDLPSRSEAIRRLIERGLGAPLKAAARPPRPIPSGSRGDDLLTQALHGRKAKAGR